MPVLTDFTAAIDWKKLCCIAVAVAGCCLPAAYGAEYDAAARQYAESYAAAAVSAFAGQKWQDAATLAETGLAYSSAVSDLWYIKAAAGAADADIAAETAAADDTAKTAAAAEMTKAGQLRCLSQAFQHDNWPCATRNDAAVLYAELLADTCKEKEALAVLHDIALPDSSVCLYISAKALYRTGEFAAARDIVAAAAELFPADSRFGKLFFFFEDPASFQTEDTQIDAALAQTLVAAAGRFAATDPEYILAAVPFAGGEAAKSALLAAYEDAVPPSARSFRYPLEAFRAGAVSPESAAASFVRIAREAGTVPLAALEDTAGAVAAANDADACAVLNAFLSSFSGTLLIDTDANGIHNIEASYKNGIPTAVSYSRYQDGEKTWQLLFDAGNPVSVTVAGLSAEFYYEDTYSGAAAYAHFPAVHSCYFSDIDTQLRFVPGALQWQPAVFVPFAVLPDCTFPVPTLDGAGLLRYEQLWAAVSGLEQPVSGMKGCRSVMRFLQGVPVSARYTENGREYASLIFNAGMPERRSVDNDRDGFFELTEYYAVAADADGSAFAAAEKDPLYERLFGIWPAPDGIYIRHITGDLNRDSKTDCSTEYLPDGSCIQQWDSYGTGSFDCGCESVLAAEKDGTVIKSAWFTNYVTGQKVTVLFQDGEPAVVESAVSAQPVHKHAGTGLYWIGQICSSETAELVLSELNLSGGSGVYIETADNLEPVHIYAVKIGQHCYAEVFDKGLLKK